MAFVAGDPLSSKKDLCIDIRQCCAQIQTVLLKLKESLRRKDAAVRLQAAAHGLLARRQVQSLRREKRLAILSRSIIGGAGSGAPTGSRARGSLSEGGVKDAHAAQLVAAARVQPLGLASTPCGSN